MSDFQEQAKNWLRNVVKQNPDKIKAGAEKAGDVIDKQTGGKYAEKVDAMQKKVGDFVDKHNTDDPATQPPAETAEADRATTGQAEPTPGQADAPTGQPETPTGQAETRTDRTDAGPAETSNEPPTEPGRPDPRP